MKEPTKKDRVAAYVCYLVAVGAAAAGWIAVAFICLMFATTLDPPIRRK